MNSKPKIGFFDSGVGGISVMTHARERLPGADYLYYADTDNVPYGTKSREQIIGYSCRAAEYLMDAGADAIVVACKTATSMAIEHLRQTYSIPFIGMEPAVKPAIQYYPHENILVCATPVTIAGEKLHNLIHHWADDEVQLSLVPTPGLVTLAENAQFDPENVCEYLRTVIDTSKHYAAVVLGCTHFSYFRDSFRAFLGDVAIIDGTAGTVNRLIHVLDGIGKLPRDLIPGSVTYIRSGRIVTDEASLAFFRLLEQRSRN